MAVSRSRLLLVLVAAGSALVAGWLLMREPAPERATPAPELPPAPSAPPSRAEPAVEAPQRVRPQQAPPRAGAERALDQLPPGPPGETLEQERERLEQLVQHQELMLAHAQEQLDALEERAENGEELDDEIERQERAISEGRQQTQLVHARLEQLNQQLP